MKDGLTKKELEGIARQALNMARTDVRNGGWKTGILLATYFRTDEHPFHRMDMIEKLLQEKLGEQWLNNGYAKDAGFGLLREAVNRFPTIPDALVIVTATNMFQPTAKMKALPIEEQRKLIETNHDDHHKMAAHGYFEIVDSFTALAQNPAFCVLAVQDADGATAPVTKALNQEDFDGRLKMFGEGRDYYRKEKVQ